MIVEVNIPDPTPSVVLVDKEIVGLVVVPQTTPLAVIVNVPEDVTLPPDKAVPLLTDGTDTFVTAVVVAKAGSDPTVTTIGVRVALN